MFGSVEVRGANNERHKKSRTPFGKGFAFETEPYVHRQSHIFDFEGPDSGKEHSQWGMLNLRVHAHNVYIPLSSYIHVPDPILHE